MTARLLSLTLIPTLFVLACGDIFKEENEVSVYRGHIRQLTNYDDWQGPHLLDWSDDGAEIIYCKRPWIAVVPAGGGIPRIMLNLKPDWNEQCQGLSWLPGSSDSFGVIISAGDNSEFRKIGIGDSDSVNWLYETSGDYLREIAFTPDRRYLVFGSRKESGGDDELIKMDLATREIETIPNTDGWSTRINDLDINPTEGNVIRYTADYRNDGINIESLRSIPIDGGQTTLIYQIPVWPGSYLIDSALSPDRNFYALTGHIVTRHIQTKNPNICLLSTATGELELLAEFPHHHSASHPVWSPDGMSIAFDYFKWFEMPNNIYIIDF